jgi:cold shock CspA family protein
MDTPFKNFFRGNKEEVAAEFAGDSGEPQSGERRVIGRIIKLSKTGYGFISSKDIPFTRVFFHWTSLKQNTLNFAKLELGMHVEFTPKEVEDKGTRAIRIVVLPNLPTSEPIETVEDTAAGNIEQVV